MFLIFKLKHYTNKEYFTGGSTALLDALGDTINELSNRQKCCKCCESCHCENKNKVIIIIITDGYENSSKEFNKEQVKKLIEDRTTNDKWEFVFLGANIDSVNAASGIGIKASCAQNFSADSEGIKGAYKYSSSVVLQFRRNNVKDIAL